MRCYVVPSPLMGEGLGEGENLYRTPRGYARQFIDESG